MLTIPFLSGCQKENDLASDNKELVEKENKKKN